MTRRVRVAAIIAVAAIGVAGGLSAVRNRLREPSHDHAATTAAAAAPVAAVDASGPPRGEVTIDRRATRDGHAGTSARRCPHDRYGPL
jgi:hypothetical protein